MKSYIFSFLAGAATAGAVALLPTFRNRLRAGIQRFQKFDLLDINSASEQDLAELPGVTPQVASLIVAHRPYRNKLDLLSQMVIPNPMYQEIRNRILVTRAAAAQPVK